jgi:uncharacterized tellurite resistance protein B-like protein
MAETKVNGGTRSKIRYLHNLVALSKADGDISDREFEFLKKKSVELGIDEVVLQALLNEATSVTTPIMDTMQERLNLMTDCIIMASLDGVITEEEIIFCLKICELLELDSSFVQEITADHNIKIDEKST